MSLRSFLAIGVVVLAASPARALPAPNLGATEQEWSSGNHNNSPTATYTKHLGVLPARVELFGIRLTWVSGPPHGAVSPDYYRFTLDATTTIHATLNNWGVDYDSSGWPILGVFALGNAYPLVESTTLNGPTGSYQTLSATLQEGEYAIAVTGSHYDTESYWQDGGLSYNWLYELTIGTSGPFPPANSHLDLESNNQLATAQPLGQLPAFSTLHGLRYQTLPGSVTPDFYAFSLAVRTRVNIHLNTWGKGYTLDRPVVGIFGAGDTQAVPPAYESSSVPDFAAGSYYQRLTAELAPGNYVLGVTGYDHDDDDYWLVGGISYDWPYEVEIEAIPVNTAAVPATNPFALALLAAGLMGFGTLAQRRRTKRC